MNEAMVLKQGNDRRRVIFQCAASPSFTVVKTLI